MAVWYEGIPDAILEGLYERKKAVGGKSAGG